MLTKILVGFLAAFFGLFSACGIALLQSGIATVYVEEGDSWIFVPVPIAAVELALFFVPVNEMEDVRGEMEQFGELIPAVMEALSECPDAVFVEVEDGSDRVIVEKSGNSLVIEVESTDESNVRVKIPLRGAKRIVNRVVDI